MPIVTSIYTIADYAQVDGCRWVTETHIDHTGETRIVSYQASDLSKAGMLLDIHRADIDAAMTEFETEKSVDQVINGEDLMAMVFFDTTRQHVAQRLFRRVAADPNPKAVTAIAPLMSILYQLHPTEADQALFLGVSIETIRTANERFAALNSVSATLNSDAPVEVK